jgi:tetratricopeptide (TPR) repeat protein
VSKTGLCVIGALLALALPAAAEDPAVLVVSQPSPGTAKGAFIDMGFYVARALEGRMRAIVFRPTLPEVRAALDAHKLAIGEVTPPLAPAAARKVAAALGATYVLQIGAASTKLGVSTEAQMETMAAAGQWITVFQMTQQPYKGRGKRPSLLEAINVHVAALTQRIKASQGTTTESPAQPPAPGGNTAETPVKPAEAPTPSGPPTAAKPAPTAQGPSASEMLVDRFRRQGDIANMIWSLRRAINERPRDAALRRELVVAYRERGWSDAAREEALRAVPLAPEDASLHRLLGDGHLDAGEVPAAIKEYQEAVRLGPKDAANHVALGDAYWNNAQADAAEKAYLAGIQADPKAPSAQRRLARVYAQRGRYADSAAAMKAAKELTNDDSSEAFAADTAALLGVVDTALSDVFAKMQNARKEFVDGSRTREETFKAYSGLEKRGQDLVDFTNALPVPQSCAAAQALYAQAATLGIQSLESALQYLETRGENDDKQATLLRLEATKQLVEGSKSLKAAEARKPAR